jgi:hypothetical protein
VTHLNQFLYSISGYAVLAKVCANLLVVAALAPPLMFRSDNDRLPNIAALDGVTLLTFQILARRFGTAGEHFSDGDLAIGAVWNHGLARLKMKLFAIEMHRDNVRLE